MPDLLNDLVLNNALIIYPFFFPKVVVANSKRDGSTRDPKEDERLVRLFVIIPKSFTDQSLRDEFSVSYNIYISAVWCRIPANPYHDVSLIKQSYAQDKTPCQYLH